MAQSNSSQMSSGVPVPWDRLRKWIDQASRDPSAVQDTHLKAVSILVPFIEEPRVSDTDYVSQLNRMSFSALPG